MSSTDIEDLTVDMYPDLREYCEDEKFDTAYTLPNGYNHFTGLKLRLLGAKE